MGEESDSFPHGMGRVVKMVKFERPKGPTQGATFFKLVFVASSIPPKLIFLFKILDELVKSEATPLHWDKPA